MKIAGIIAEYNPFHKGHAYHIRRTREKTGADFVIAVVSGDFVQRGGPAFLPKHLRAEMALAGGADLVFELPSVLSCQSAEFFARRGVELLQGLGCLDYLSFGSESGDIRLFQSLGEYLTKETPAFRQKLQKGLKAGLSYPAARRDALLAVWDGAEGARTDWESFLSSPNNILGVEYCKALADLKSPIQPVTVLRKGSGYHEQLLNQELPSASALRNFWVQSSVSQPCGDFSGPFSRRFSELSSGFPTEVLEVLKKSPCSQEILTEEDFSLLMRWMLYSRAPESLYACQDMSRDLVQRLINTRGGYETFSQYVGLLKTKELTYSRICRALFHALLEIRDVPPVSYARLLGFRRQAAPVLSEIKRKGTLPLLTKLADAPSILSPDAMKVLEQNIRISHLYETVASEKYRRKFIHEYTRQMVILP
ncbi:MAG: nucleotidyltransferase family protein [Clostridiales bacterium]|nr:nucleotidyltransferase family protein [Clostridiales bacterium]